MTRHKLFLAVFVSLVLTAPLFLLAQQEAAETSVLLPPEEEVFGQNQYYSVVFDGEGEAAVAAKLVLQNNSKEEISSTIIEVPGTNIRMIRAVQEVYEKEKVCRYWDQVCVEEGSQGCLKYERKCTDWDWRIRRWQPKYYTLEPKAEELSNSVKYTFDLQAPLQEQDESSLLLYYKAPGYAQKSRGVFNFVFETIKAPYDVNQLRVAVNVQEGLYLKGGKAKTQYRPNYSVAFKEMAPQAAGVESEAMRGFSQQIAYVSGYVKTTSGLDPWESFKVEGKYAESRFALYQGAIIAWSLGGLIFFGGLGLLVWFLIRRSRKKLQEGAIGSREHLLPLKIIAAGFGSAVGIILAVYLGLSLGHLIMGGLSYQYASFVGLLLVLVTAVLVLAFLLGPPIYFGLKYGAGRGFWVMAVTIVSLVILAALMILFLGLFQGQQNQPGGPIRPLLEVID